MYFKMIWQNKALSIFTLCVMLFLFFFWFIVTFFLTAITLLEINIPAWIIIAITLASTSFFGTILMIPLNYQYAMMRGKGDVYMADKILFQIQMKTFIILFILSLVFILGMDRILF